MQRVNKETEKFLMYLWWNVVFGGNHLTPFVGLNVSGESNFSESRSVRQTWFLIPLAGTSLDPHKHLIYFTRLVKIASAKFSLIRSQTSNGTKLEFSCVSVYNDRGHGFLNSFCRLWTNRSRCYVTRELNEKLWKKHDVQQNLKQHRGESTKFPHKIREIQTELWTKEA